MGERSPSLQYLGGDGLPLQRAAPRKAASSLVLCAACVHRGLAQRSARRQLWVYFLLAPCLMNARGEPLLNKPVIKLSHGTHLQLLL